VWRYFEVEFAAAACVGAESSLPAEKKYSAIRRNSFSQSEIDDEATTLQFFAGDDGIEKSVARAKIRALKTFWQFLTNRLLDQRGARKTNQCARLGWVQSPSMAKLAVTPPVVGSVK